MESLDPFSLADCANKIHNAFSWYHKVEKKGLPFSEFVLYKLERQDAATGRLATNKILHDLMDAVVAYQKEGVDYLKEQYVAKTSINDLVDHHGFDPTWISRTKKAAMLEMARALLSWEKTARQQKATLINRYLHQRLLPPPTERMVGLETLVQKIESQLVSPRRQRFLILTGSGGLGKTTVASALMRRLVFGPYFEDGAWVTAQPMRLLPTGKLQPQPDPALTLEAIITQLAAQILGDDFMGTHHTQTAALAALHQKLDQKDYLIAIDNLETLKDVTTILHVLRRFPERTHFLLTSRKDPGDEDVSRFPIKPLDRELAYLLMRQEASILEGYALEVLEADDDELEMVYQKLGGNPLALHLFMGQAQRGSFRTVLKLLTEARGSKAQNLYNYIYKAAWENMDGVTQRVFTAMPIIMDKGDDADQISRITRLPVEAVLEGLDTLMSQNFVDVQKTVLSAPSTARLTYHIHPLTRTFLETAQLSWKKVA